MLTLSIPTQNHFGSPTLSPNNSPTTSRPPLLQPALRPPTLMNPAAPRRSMMPQMPSCSSKRPKLSLQTAILPQPVSPALPLPCSADTPTSRNTLANSFRSPGPEKQMFERAEIQTQQQQQVGKEHAQLPYGVESVRDGILKNGPLAKLIRSRKQEKRRNGIKVGIKFVEEPQLIPRPPQDLEPDINEDVDEAPAPTSASSASENNVATPASATSTDGEISESNRLKSNDSTEWRRLRTQRSANEGRELRRSSVSTPVVSATSSTSTVGGAPSSPAPSDLCSESSDCMPPQTPETPSPAQTRDWVWTLGNDFNSRSHSANHNDWAPYTPPDSSDSSRRSSATTGESGPSALPISMPMPSRGQLSAAIKTPPVIGGRLPDTPVSATDKEPATPRSVPLPETPAPGRQEK